MNNPLRQLTKKEKQISLKSTVLSLFFFVTIILVIILSSQLLYLGQKLSYESIDIKLNGLVKEIQSSIKSNTKINSNIVTMLNLKNITDTPDFYVNILKNNPTLYSAYTGYSDGGFYEIINLDIHLSLRKIYNATSKDKWLLIKISPSNKDKKEVILLDETLKITTSKIEPNSYNPTSRPWYNAALKSDTFIKTSPYEFSNIPAKGITYAHKTQNSNNVVAIDVLIYDIQTIFQNHIDVDYMDAYLFNKDHLIISSLFENTSLLELFLKQNNDLESYKNPTIQLINNQKYIVQIVPLNNQEFVALFANYDEVISPYRTKVFYLVILFLGTLLFVIPLVIYFSNVIIKPIYQLVEESKKVKNREFHSITKVDSRVLEVALLSSSMEEMAQSIHSYQHSLEEKVKQRTLELELKNEELLKLSITDKLTGLYNRVKLDKTLLYEMNQSLRYENNFCIILIDIDFFKKVNDGYGHQVGDDVLVQSAEVLRNNIRNIDILGRWGGEEFLIICPNTNLEGANVLAKKINNAIKNYTFTTYPKTVTMSLGVSCFAKGLTKVEEIVANADHALYEAKKNGRDQVVIFQKNS